MLGPDLKGVSLLERLNDELGEGHRVWSDLVLLRNTGPLETVMPLSGDRISTRGFNALLLGPNGDPTHYLKVRPVDHSEFEREAGVLTALASHSRAGSLVVSPATTFVHGPMRVLVACFFSGRSLNAILRKKRKGRMWVDSVEDFLGTGGALWDALRDVMERERRLDWSQSFEETPHDLVTINLLGLSESVTGNLKARIEGVQLPSVPQHGDLWPRNVLKVGGGWRILDFETSGTVDLPMYDLFHLIRGSVLAAGGVEPGVWLRWWATAASNSLRLRQETGKHCQNMSRSQVEAALVAYLVNFAARFHRRGVPQKWTAPFVREIESLPSLLDEGWVWEALHHQ